MSAPVNRQEVPEPHRDWVGSQEVDAAPGRSLAKRARLWRPLKTLLEPTVATLARYAHRLIDRTTGIPYSADELEAKILAQTGNVTTGQLTTSTGAAAEAGKLGEYFESTPAAYAALTSVNFHSLGSINLTAGDWDVTASVKIRMTAATVNFALSAIHNAVLIPVAGFPLEHSAAAASGMGVISATHHTRRIRLATPTTYHIVVQADFTGTVEATGQITARRAQ